MQSKSSIQKDLIVNPDKERLEDLEESRVVTPKSLIRYLINGKIEIMYSNGNFSQYDPATDLWTITNNNGKRRCKRQSTGEVYDIDPIPAAVETCAETSAKVLFKEDNVISILYQNGTRYTIHHDGTKILTNYDQTEVVFEKVGYSLVKVLSGRMLDEPEKVYKMDASDADIEFYESLQVSRRYLKEKLKDCQIMQTYLHDKTIIQSFVEINEFSRPKEETEQDLQQEHTEDQEANPDQQEDVEAEGTKENQAEGESPEQTQEKQVENEDNFSYQAVHLIRRQDMSITKISQDGEACFISGSTRMELNKNGSLMKLGRDIDYLNQMFSTRPEERKGGVFTCSLQKSNIITHDKHRNFFAVNSNGTFEKVLAPEISEVDQVNEIMDQEDMEEVLEMEREEMAVNSQGSKGGASTIPKVDFEKSKIKQEDQSASVSLLPIAPRIFYIKNDGSGSEFYTKDLMQDETGRFTHDVVIVKNTEVLGQNPVYMHSYFKPLKTN